MTVHGNTKQYDSTIVFNKGSRSYTNAYAVIPHLLSEVMVDINMEKNEILSIDEESISTYFIDEPIISVFPTEDSLMNKDFEFVLRAESKNEYSNQTLTCLL